MQKLCCVRTRQHPLPVWSHNLSLTNLLISPSILNHFRWELYQSMLEYKVFKKWDKAILDKHKKVLNPPKGYHRIKVHLVFAVKFDGRHKARLVADGHLAPEPIENIFSGVVSLRSLSLVIFLGKLNHLELRGADIGNAHLEAFTDEKLYIVAAPEFQELECFKAPC